MWSAFVLLLLFANGLYAEQEALETNVKAEAEPAISLSGIRRPKFIVPDCDIVDEKQLSLIRVAYQHSCGSVAKSLKLPKVALLFMVQTSMPLEQVWDVWFENITGRIPVQILPPVCGAPNSPPWPQLIDGEVSPEDIKDATNVDSDQWKLCREIISSAHTPPYYRQMLYSIHVHVMQGFNGFSRCSIFRGRAVQSRLPGQRLSHSLVLIQRQLVEEALKDPTNQRFVFVSESHVPLYPASVVYMQFIHEPLARVAACPPTQAELEKDDVSLWRWKPELCSKEQWRKSEHWTSLTRKVAQIFVTEQEVQSRFIQHCRRHCSNVEHYLATMLAVHGYENETSCVWSTTYVDWWTHVNLEGRPKKFKAEDLSEVRLQKCRVDRCSNKLWPAVATSEQALLDMRIPKHDNLCKMQVPLQYPALNPECRLFLRKVDEDAADKMVALLDTFHYEEWYWYVPDDLEDEVKQRRLQATARV